MIEVGYYSPREEGRILSHVQKKTCFPFNASVEYLGSKKMVIIFENKAG